MSDEVIQCMFDECDPQMFPDWVTFHIYMAHVLDLAEVVLGDKPIFSTRGQSDLPMIENAIAMLGLQSLTGPCWWVAGDLPDQWPDEMVCRLEMSDPIPYYFMQSGLADELAAINDRDGEVTVEQEARLLKYPVCCVDGFHSGHRKFLAAVPRTIETAAAREGVTITDIIDFNTVMPIEGDDLLEPARLGYLAPFCSFALCDSCHADVNSPGQIASRRREQFAATVMPDTLVQQVKEALAMRGPLSDWKTEFRSDGLTWDYVQSVIEHRSQSR